MTGFEMYSVFTLSTAQFFDSGDVVVLLHIIQAVTNAHSMSRFCAIF